jgi:hypothetical protein
MQGRNNFRGATQLENINIFHFILFAPKCFAYLGLAKRVFSLGPLFSF